MPKIPDIEKVAKGLQSCAVDQNCIECPYIEASPYGGDVKCMDILNGDALILINGMKEDLLAAKSCATCAYNDDAACNQDGEGKAFERWRGCGGSMKKNWKWRGGGDGEQHSPDDS